MKATLKFNLPEEQTEFNFATQGSDWWNVCWDMDQWLRQQYKYMPDEEYSQEKLEAYVEVRDKLLELINNNGLDLDQ